MGEWGGCITTSTWFKIITHPPARREAIFGDGDPSLRRDVVHVNVAHLLAREPAHHIERLPALAHGQTVPEEKERRRRGEERDEERDEERNEERDEEREEETSLIYECIS